MGKQDFRPSLDDEIPVDEKLLGDFLEKFYDSGNETRTNFTDVYSMYEYVYKTGFPEHTVSSNLVLYVSPILLLLGTFGNIFSVIIMSKLCTEVLSSCVYLAILGVFDTLVLWAQCGNEWYLLLTKVDLNWDIRESSNIACKMHYFALHFVQHMYRWMVACVSIETFIAYGFPDKLSRMCTLSRAKAIVLLITVLLVCTNIHYFWTHELINPKEHEIEDKYGSQDRCLEEEGHKFEAVIRPTMEFLLKDVVPLLIILIFSLLVIVCMCCRNSQNKYAKETDKAWRKRYLLYPYAFERLKIVLFVICILYVITHLPNIGHDVFFKYLEIKYKFLDHTLRLNAQQKLAKVVCDMVQYLYLTVKFYIYFAICKQFRDEFVKLFRRIFSCSKCTQANHSKPQETLLLPQTSSSHYRLHYTVECNGQSGMMDFPPYTANQNYAKHTNV